MNAKLPRQFALGTAMVLGGCTASASFMASETAHDPVQVVSRWPSSEPDFGTTPYRADIADEPVEMRRSDRTSLVGLYGELESDVTGLEANFDGSSNVAQITFATEGACSDPDVDRQGKWMVFASTQHRETADIYLKPVTGRTLTQLTSDPADDIMPALHPAGDRIAFASNRAGNWDIYVMSIDGGQPMKVTDEPEHELHPSWSPDGQKLVYCKMGSQSGRWELWVVDMTNPGVRRFLDYGLFPQWCPDIARPKILMQRARGRGSRYFSVWTIDYINGDALHPTEILSAGNAAIINPAWSPDGSRIVFVTVVEPGDDADMDGVGQSDIWIANLDGSGRTNLTNGHDANYQPVWASDGRVYFVTNRTGVDNVWSVATSRAIDANPQPARITSAVPDGETDYPSGRP